MWPVFGWVVVVGSGLVDAMPERYVYVGCSHNTASERLAEGEEGPPFRK